MFLAAVIAAVLICKAAAYSAYCPQDIYPDIYPKPPVTNTYQYGIESGRCSGQFPVQCQQNPYKRLVQVEGKVCDPLDRTPQIKVQPDLRFVNVYRASPCAGYATVTVSESCLNAVE